MTTPLPSPDTLARDMARHLRYYLSALHRTTDADTAVDYIRYILDAGSRYDPGELLRSIEARLPAPTRVQQELAGLCRSSDDEPTFCRCLGAFGDDVIIVCTLTDKPLKIRTAKLRIPRTSQLTLPSWDAKRPAVRRTLDPIIDADTIQAEQNEQKPRQQPAIMEA